MKVYSNFITWKKKKKSIEFVSFINVTFFCLRKSTKNKRTLFVKSPANENTDIKSRKIEIKLYINCKVCYLNFLNNLDHILIFLYNSEILFGSKWNFISIWMDKKKNNFNWMISFINEICFCLRKTTQEWMLSL